MREIKGKYQDTQIENEIRLKKEILIKKSDVLNYNFSYE